MRIAIITIPGAAKQSFVNELHEKTNGKVDLVVIQKAKELSLWKRLVRLARRVGLWHIPREIWYGLLLRLNGTRHALEYFRAHTEPQATYYAPPTLEVDSVNNDEAYQALKKLSPDLLVIWGSAVLEPRILGTARKAINLHMGRCPYYRGALANQHAVLRGDLNHIGATIHYASEKVDAGNILAFIEPDLAKSPRDMFCDLNDRSRAVYLDIAIQLTRNEPMPAEAQDISTAKNLLLKYWVPSVRYTLAEKVIKWEQAHRQNHTEETSVA